MGKLYSLEEQADSFASSFPDVDRSAVRDWYIAQLQEDERKSFWKMIEAGVTVFLLVGVLPSLAFLAYFQLS